MTAGLSPEREQEIRQAQPGGWYGGPWVQEYVVSDRDGSDWCEVRHAESGTVLAELPDWAGGLALWMCDAHDAVPELLAEVERLRRQRLWLLDQIRRKDARSGEADRALRAFLAGPGGDDEDVAQTRPCGHDDYHSAHAWADRPHNWCPGHTVEDPAVDRARVERAAAAMDVPPHPAPCRHPASPDCICWPLEVQP